MNRRDDGRWKRTSFRFHFVGFFTRLPLCCVGEIRNSNDITVDQYARDGHQVCVFALSNLSQFEPVRLAVIGALAG